MVRQAFVAASVLLAAHPATAADWRLAGGSLFVGAAPPAMQSTPISPPTADDRPFSAEIEAAALAHDLDPELLRALVVVESGFRPDALSPAGAAGLAQLMPATARELGVSDRLDPLQSLMGGAAYLARQIREFGSIALALAAYNAGPARVRQHGGAPPFAETRGYVRAVTNCFLALEAGRSVRSSADCASAGSEG